MFNLRVTGDIKESIRVPDVGYFNVIDSVVKVKHRQDADYLVNNGAGRDGMIFQIIDKKDIPDFSAMKKPPPIVKLEGPKPKVSVSVLMCNRPEYSMECVSSILTAKTGIEYELILTDNGSTDKGVTKKYLEELENDKIVKVFHENNLGFIKGHEYALSVAKNEIFLMLNNDCVVCDNWLDKIVDGFDHHLVRLVGIHSAIMQDDGNGHRYNADDFDYIEGDCFAVPKIFIKLFGLFSPYLEGSYGEDFDLCMRLIKSGYTIKRVNAGVKHDRNILTISTLKDGKQLANNSKNKKVLFEKWGKTLKDKRRNANARTP